MVEAAEVPGVIADAGWEDPPRRMAEPAGSAMPMLHLDGFDGPMDLLLDLAERQRIDLGRMSMLALAEQFVAEMERLTPAVPVQRRADWLVLATRLVLLRSRLLFPATPDEARAAERDAAAEERRLGEMAFLRRASAWLDARPQLGADVFVRPQPAPPRPEGGYVALMEACLVVLRGGVARRGGAEPVYRPAVLDLWRVADALDRIRSTLAEHPDGGELARFLPDVAAEGPDRTIKVRAALASTLLAGLEMTRLGQVELTQEQTWGTVHLRTAANLPGTAEATV